MSAPHRRREPLAGGPSAQSSTDTSKTKSGRRENQGIAPDRNRDQRPPIWPEPVGVDAARLLADLWGRK
jgi:hypothetical protein